MRTYILSLADLASGKRKKFRCQAASLEEAVEKATRNNPGFFDALSEEATHATAKH